MSTLPGANAFIRAAWFLENYQWDVKPARERGEIDVYLTPLDRKYSMVATRDIGELAAQTLQEEWSGNRFLELEGPEQYSPADAAAAGVVGALAARPGARCRSRRVARRRMFRRSVHKLLSKSSARYTTPPPRFRA